MRERSLVAFTLLSQTAVGAFWALGVVQLWMMRQVDSFGADLTTVSSAMVVLLMSLAILASTQHLGTPRKAWRAVANVRSSWLSREILFALLFAAASALFAALQWRHLGSAALRCAVGGIAAVLGLLLILSMANAYRLRTVPAWDRWTTIASFLITTCLLGGLGVGVILGDSTSVSSDLLWAGLRWIAPGAIVALCLDLLVVRTWVTGLSSAPGAASRTAARITRERRGLFQVRLALAVAAAVASGAALLPWGAEAGAPVSIAAAFALALASRVLDRALFYEARVRHGV